MELVLNTYGVCLNRDNEGFVISHGSEKQRIPAEGIKSILISVKNSDPLVRKVITDTFKLLAKSSWDEAKATVKNKVHR